jgi:hypothetical protein
MNRRAERSADEARLVALNSPRQTFDRVQLAMAHVGHLEHDTIGEVAQLAYVAGPRVLEEPCLDRATDRGGARRLAMAMRGSVRPIDAAVTACV